MLCLAQVITDMAEAVVAALMQRLSQRLGVPTATLFPGYSLVRQMVFPAGQAG